MIPLCRGARQNPPLQRTAPLAALLVSRSPSTLLARASSHRAAAERPFVMQKHIQPKRIVHSPTFKRMMPTQIVLPLCLAAALFGCGMNETDLDPGTFELTVSGDMNAVASGSARVAAADSGLNVTDQTWQVAIPIEFDAGRSDIRFVIYLFEPTDPNGNFTELPIGTFQVGSSPDNDAYPSSQAFVTIGERPVEGIGEGTLRLQRTLHGIEGKLDSPYSSRGFSGSRTRGHVSARFHIQVP